VPFISFTGRSCFAERSDQVQALRVGKLKSPPMRVVFQFPRLAFSSPLSKHESPCNETTDPKDDAYIKKQAFHLVECLFSFLMRGNFTPSPSESAYTLPLFLRTAVPANGNSDTELVPVHLPGKVSCLR